MNNPYVKTLKPIWGNLDYVSVNEERLQELIAKMETETLEVPSWSFPNVHPPIDCKPTEWIEFICWINTVNFAFTNFESPYNKFTVEYPEGSLWNGAFAMQASFMRAHNEGMKVFDAEHMSRISLAEVDYIFRSIDEAHKIPMLRERHAILKEVGRVLLEKYSGSWLNLFLEGRFRAFDRGGGIVERLVADFPSFCDTRNYKSRSLLFHKRAQLLVMMYYGRAFNMCTMPIIEDIKNIGPICDYDVPRALRFPEVGVLEYSPEMAEYVDNEKIVYPGHPFETENRLATAYVMTKICDELGCNMAEADYYVWSIGRKSEQPHILVPTTDY